MMIACDDLSFKEEEQLPQRWLSFNRSLLLEIKNKSLQIVPNFRQNLIRDRHM